MSISPLTNPETRPDRIWLIVDRRSDAVLAPGGWVNPRDPNAVVFVFDTRESAVEAFDEAFEKWFRPMDIVEHVLIDDRYTRVVG